MKEIRFRAFQDNEMYVQPLPGIYGLKRFLSFIYEDCELMQYTGFKDKNDKMIFEGDIVKHDIWGKFQCIFDNGSFRLINKTSDLSLDHAQLNRCKVIGNIHEDKHLLEVKL